MADIPVFQSSGGAAKMAAEFGVPYVGKLPMDPALGLAGERGVAVGDVAKAGPAARALPGAPPAASAMR